MKKYLFKKIEVKWQNFWKTKQIFKTEIDLNKPKFYVLSMFPYPSGSGLHVGHPLGYIASDIVARFKVGQGFNVLHPMGFDAFGLPAEQHALQTGEHPAVSSKKNIDKYREQLEKIGLAYDWNRMICTTDSEYYKWTQWIVVQIFNSWYDHNINQARPIEELIAILNCEGNLNINASCNENTPLISANQWMEFSYEKQQLFLLNYRLVYPAESYVNWCEELGTVLSNDEVKDNRSERGGYPVEKKLMKQWMMRISAYAERLLTDLDELDWPESVKTVQRNWIGKSIGCKINFQLAEPHNDVIQVFTTKPETIFGVTYLAISTTHPLIKKLSSELIKKAEVLNNQIDKIKKNGFFTGIFAIHPFTKYRLPIWVANFVVQNYGSGATMSVPALDERDREFAHEFNLPTIDLLKDNLLINSDFINGKNILEAKKIIIEYLDKIKIGQLHVSYRLYDAVFSRQRYWGEPLPIFYDKNIAKTPPSNDLPIILPEVDDYRPTSNGRSPLAQLIDWKFDGHQLETDTMPSWAGSSWYFFRYMDPDNISEFVSNKTVDYWRDVDLYIGGPEHSTGHLIYSRFWTKFLYDRKFIPIKEPFKKLFNQGMIQGRSSFIYRICDTNQYISFNLKDSYDTVVVRIAIELVDNDVLNINKLKSWRKDFADAEFILENGSYICGFEIEKMSKSKYNIITPESVIDHYGADTLRLYVMFLGPLETCKIWNTKGIEGVYRYLVRVWKLFYNNENEIKLSNDAPSLDNFKTLHSVIKKVHYAIENMSFNTAISAFMVAMNEFEMQKCNSLEVLLPYLVLLSPFAPHICEELWQSVGKQTSIHLEAQPVCDDAYLVVNTYTYPISINGKVRAKLEFGLEEDLEKIKKNVICHEMIKKWINGAEIKKIVFIQGKIINIVL